jgi:hypothetical protein
MLTRNLFFIFTLSGFIAHCAIVTQIDSNGHGYFSLNNAKVALRGTNYLRLINASHHVNFEPDLYHFWDIDGALEQMQNYGYNYVRVFLECPSLIHGFNLSSPGVPMNYTKNVIDFLIRAANHNLSVMLTSSWNPANYQSIIDSYPKPANVTGTNEIIFHVGQAVAKAQFFKDFLQQVKDASPIAFQAIFAIDIFNEICVSVHEKPFSITSRIVVYNGVPYDMAKGSDRQQLLDLAANIWMNTSVVAIKSIAPTILVTASLFSPNVVGHNGFDGVQPRPPDADARYPLRAGSLVNSLADYIDLHIYAGGDPKSAMEGAALPRSKPILMGETGAYRPWFKNTSIAASVIQNVMIESLNFGYTAWGIWNWDTLEELTFWTLTEDNNALNNVLSPKAWPIVGPNKTSILFDDKDSILSMNSFI